MVLSKLYCKHSSHLEKLSILENKDMHNFCKNKYFDIIKVVHSNEYNDLW